MSSEYKNMCWRGWIPKNMKRSERNQKFCLRAETSPAPKMFLLHIVSSFSFHSCTPSCIPQNMFIEHLLWAQNCAGYWEVWIEATCPQGQVFLPRMFCPCCCSVRSSWTPQSALTVSRSLCLSLDCAFRSQHLCYCMKAIIHFKDNL